VPLPYLLKQYVNIGNVLSLLLNLFSCAFQNDVRSAEKNFRRYVAISEQPIDKPRHRNTKSLGERDLIANDLAGEQQG
jgi:hypothetical protein